MTSSLWSPTVTAVDTQLREELASIQSALYGAGMVGFDPALPYPDNSIGKALKALSPATAAEYADIRLYGAIGDGVADDTAAINACIAANSKIFIPAAPNYWKITSSLNITASNKKILGADRFLSKIQMNNGIFPMFAISAALSNVEISNLSLSRTTSASATGHGINCNFSATSMLFTNLIIENQWDGMHLGPAERSLIYNCQVQNNYNHGISLESFINANMTWNIAHSNTSYNVNNGINVAGVGSAVVTTLGEFTAVVSEYNGNYGLSVIGTASKRITSLRVNGGVYSYNGAGGIYVDSYSTRHRIVGVSANLSGTAATGRQASPIGISSIGSGITFTANNNEVNISGCVCIRNSYAGMDISSPFGTITGNTCNSNGANATAAAAMRTGIKLSGGKFTCSGNSCANTAGDTNQVNGIHLSTLLASIVAGNNCDANTGNGIHFLSGAGVGISDNNLLNNGVALLNAAGDNTSRVTGNLGFNPQPADTVAIGTSPWTYTAGNTPETIYWRGGTVSVVAIDGLTIATASTGAAFPSTIELGPNESMTLTFSVVPTNFTRKRH